MMLARCVLLVCIVGTALPAFVDLGQGAERAIVGTSGTSAQLPQLGSTQAAMAGAAGRAAKVSAELSRIGTLKPQSLARFDYRYLTGARTRPPVSSIDPERVRLAILDLVERFEPAVDEINADVINADFFAPPASVERFLGENLDQAIYAGLRNADDVDGENATNAILATMLADLIDRVGTTEFDKVNLARLTASPPGRPSTNEQLLLSAVQIARGEFKAARDGLDAVVKVKTLGDARKGLVERYRLVADFLDPDVDLQAVPRDSESGPNRVTVRYRPPVIFTPEEIPSVLTPLDGRLSTYSNGTRTRAPEVDAILRAAYAKVETELTSFELRGSRSSEAIRGLIRSIEDEVRRKDLDAALAKIDELKRSYEEPEVLRGPRAEWRLRLALERLEDATRVLATRFVDEDEPFFVTVNKNFFGSPARSYEELPAPVAQFAEALNNRLRFSTANTREDVQRPVFLALNEFFNAIFDGAEPNVTNRLGNAFFRASDRAEKLIRFGQNSASAEKDSRKVILADARRFAALFREGKKSVGATNTTYVAPQVSDEISDLAARLNNQHGAGKAPRANTAAGADSATVEGAEPARKYLVRSTRARSSSEMRDRFGVDEQFAFDSLQRSVRDLELQPGYQPNDLIELIAELIVIAGRGEDLDDAYKRLIEPVLAFPQNRRGTLVFRNGSGVLEQLRKRSAPAQNKTSARKGASK